MTAYLGAAARPARPARLRQLLRLPAPGGRRKLGRLLAALGDADDPGSLRSRTVVVRCADHGEMGLSHGGLRQKMFNTYEETINVPLVFSNPALFADAARDRRARVAGRRRADVAVARRRRGQRRAARPRPDAGHGTTRRPRAPSCSALGGRPRHVLDHPSPAPSVQDAIHFTYDDHQAATAMQDAPGQPNRIRAVRDARLRSTPSTSTPRGTSGRRVRALRPRARPAGGREPARRAHRRAALSGGRGPSRRAQRAARRGDGRRAAPHPRASLSTRTRSLRSTRGDTAP